MSTGKCGTRERIPAHRVKCGSLGVRNTVARVTARNDSPDGIGLNVQFESESATETEVS
jgi:hypothetical protein